MAVGACVLTSFNLFCTPDDGCRKGGIMFDAYYRRKGCYPHKGSGSAGVPGGSSTGPIVISSPVGNGGSNLPADVATIQDALNQVSDDQGGAAPDLVVDSFCGPKTIKAIQTFQLRHLGWSGADGLVEPNRQTIAKLNEILGSPFAQKESPEGHPLPWAPLTGDWMPDAEAFRMALKMIDAALANLTSASHHLESTDVSPGGLSVFSRAERMRLLNKHFMIDTFKAEKRQKFEFIQLHFRRMKQVFERPGGLWGPAAFTPDPLNDSRPEAYAGKGGFFRGGQFSSIDGVPLRVDSIYICRGFSAKPRLEQATILVHELAHFVGHPERITDHKYYFEPGYSTLQARLRVVNSDNYTDFAMEADTGKVQKDL